MCIAGLHNSDRQPYNVGFGLIVNRKELKLIASSGNDEWYSIWATSGSVNDIVVCVYE